MGVQPSGSTERAPGHILERLEQWVEDHPEATKYYINGEEEAAQLLLAMVATMRGVMKDIHNKADQNQIREVARSYQRAVMQGKALETFRDMTEDDQLSLYGVDLVAARIVLQ